ncbi:hypothetical protein QQ054_38030 [Oscillatoria amoena NRMC-F 0135]|nr:hypothetical protein [Oscillatoria amoena NRMC-F 0135]
MADEKELTLEESHHSFRFTRRPMAIAAELRPDWKMAALLLILQLSSRGGKSSLRRLHILNWALRSPRNRAEFEQVRKHQQPLFSFQFRFEPALGRAINLAVGEKLVEWVGDNRLQITAKGKRWITDISKDESVMFQEREFLKRIGKDITEAFAMEMITVRPI